MTQITLYAAAASVVISGVTAGIFFAFSDFVMRALAGSSTDAGIEAMQIINRKIYSSVFLVLIIGLAIFAIGFAVFAWLKLSGPAAAWIIAGAIFYLVGVFLVTLIFNVPMNNKLDALPLGDPETANYWTTYVRTWTRWNHLRSFACIASTSCYLAACIHLSRL